MSFKFRNSSFLICFILLWRFHRANCYIDVCDQPHPAVYCSCETSSKETTVTCFVYGDLKKTDEIWSSFSSVENAVALTLHSRLPIRLEYIPSEPLKEMPDLQSLVVQEGNLGQLQSYSVSNMTTLKTLMLERNDITSLERHAISNLPKLRKLALSENLLSELLAESLYGLAELEQLFLDRNNISRIESCAFCDLQNLKELELWGNEITDLTEYTFRGLRYLKRLDLYKNQIGILNDKVFHSMPRLLEIDLKDNLIEYIAPRAFHGLDGLQRLMLNQNKLKILPNKVFKSLPSLRSVDLYSNHLETLQVEVLQNMAHSRDEHFTFSFKENPLICDCNLHWVRSYLKINKSHQLTRELQELKCRTENDELQHAKLLKLDCDKQKSSPVASTIATGTSAASMISMQPKELSYNESAIKALYDGEEDDDVDEYFGDVHYGSGNYFLVSDLRLVLLTFMFVFVVDRHRRT